MAKYNMPVGKSNFAQVRTDGDYYIDKTDLIRQIASSGTQVTLFTRPRRFGKSLNMSMLQHFFDIREDSKAFFDGLSISDNKEICGKWMNQYPTVLISFKEIEGSTFDDAYGLLKAVVSKLYEKHQYLEEDDKLTKRQKMLFEKYILCQSDKTELRDSLYLLTDIMYHYYNKPVILLIDEYDVPMAKGASNKYYDQITDIMRSIYSKSLKDNPYIKIAVLTGCLRISKESIFTGLNNLSVKSITDSDYDECFGFTNAEMDKLLTDTGLIDKQQVFKDWYDGYVFGKREVYCPWDVLNYADALQKDPEQAPLNYWANTSGNDVIKQFLESGFDVTRSFEILLSGGYVEQKINPNITYEDLTKSEMNLWSVLYMTGYLTTIPKSTGQTNFSDSNNVRGMFEDPFNLRIPNREIRLLFEETVAQWFTDTIVGEDRTELFNAIWDGDADKLTVEICKYLGDTSYYDYKEDFYHAFLAGLLSGVKGIKVESNREVGTGRADVILKNPRMARVAVFEFKHAASEADMEKKCNEAVEQITKKEYSFPFRNETIRKYGIAFFQKKCIVKEA